jgi:hypothetical protein
VFTPEDAALLKFFNPNPKFPLHVGELWGVEQHIPVILRGENLVGSHSCIFGSSGSGKTTLLGLLLEEILLKIPDSQIVVLDLNSDFAKFDHAIPDGEVNSENHHCQKIASGDLKTDQDNLKKLTRLNRSPTVRMDRFSHNELMQIENIPYHYSTQEWYERVWKSLSGAGVITPQKCEQKLKEEITARQKGRRSRGGYPLQEEDLKGGAILADFFARIKDAPIWSSKKRDSLDLLRSNRLTKRFLQFDLGRLRFVDRAILAGAVLKELWERNEKKKSHTFIVIDEAHNVAPAIPEEWQRRTLEWVNRISGEGRKYGLYLILVSQRPAKIHSNALDNCRNFFILRLENRDDLDSLSRRTVEVSESLLSRAATFRNHEALPFGDLCPSAIIHPGRRRMK